MGTMGSFFSKHLCIAVFLALFAQGQAAQAALVNYFETNDGELPSSAAAGPLFTLDMAGVHTWNGSTTANYVDSFTQTLDQDFFKFDLTPGLQVTSIHLVTSSLVSSNWISTEFALRVQAGTQETGPLKYADQRDVIGGDPQYDFFYSELPLSGTYLTSLRPLYGNTSCPSGLQCSASWDWALTMTVADPNAPVVPIPGAAWLFASALGVLGYLAKRKATS
jgi:hypothetical protein